MPKLKTLLKWLNPLIILRWILGFAKRHPIILTLIVLVMIPIVTGLVWLLKPEQPEYILATAERGNLVQTVEAVGTVTSEKDLTLKFPVTGVVGEVLVREGDKVTAGQELASLRNEALAADVQGAYANLAAKQASLNALREGTRPEDISIAEAGVDNKRATLAAAKATLTGAEEKLRTAEIKLEQLLKEADVSLSGYLSTSQSTASQQLNIAQSAIKSVDDVFSANSVESNINQDQPAAYSVFIRRKDAAEESLSQAERNISGGFSDYRIALTTLEQVRSALFEAASVVDEAYTFITNLPLAGAFTSSVRETHKTTLSTQSKNAQSAFAAIDTATKNLRDAAANFDTKIATEENNVATAQSTKETALADILTYETSLRAQEAELAKSKAGARQTDIDGAAALVNQAAAELNRAKARLEDTILRAPFDGEITKVDMKAGEFTGDFDNFNYAISMLGASPYRVEMNISEIDIPKVQLSQTGAIELDAFPGTDVALHVSEIDPIASTVDGVSKYLVTLDFIDPPLGLRIGMSGDAEIYIARRNDVVMIPERAVITMDGENIVRILSEQNEMIERAVVTGIDSPYGNIEIVEGISEGEQIIVLVK